MPSAEDALPIKAESLPRPGLAGVVASGPLRVWATTDGLSVTARFATSEARDNMAPMTRVVYTLLVVTGALFGLVVLVALLASMVGDAKDLFDNLGWIGIVVFLTWPALMTVGVFLGRRAL